MRKLFVVLFVLATAATAYASDWALAGEKLKASVVFLETSSGTCTAFVIHEQKNLVLTAAHCFDSDGVEKMFVDNKPVTKLVAKDTKKDLLVLQVDDLDRPALKLAPSDPKLGDSVASYGYGYGLESPLLKVHHVAADKLHIDQENIGGPLIAVDTSYVNGMSGGPLVNMSGEVVGVVQLGTNLVGFGVGAETIQDKVGRYFEK